MSARTIRLLAVAVLVLFAAVWLLNRQQTGDTTTEELLFPGLKERLDDVTEVRISDADGEVRIVREGDRWVVPAKGGYPADTAVLRDLLLGIAEAKKVERKTSNSELYDQLGVEDPQEEGASGRLVQSAGLGDQDFALILGDPVQREYRYVRDPDESTSWLIDRNPDVPEEAGGWLLSDVVDLASSRVQSVTIRHDDGQTIRIHKESEDDTNFTVEDIPQGRELSYPSVANSIAAALDSLTLEDVRRAASRAAEAGAAEETGEAATATTVFTTFDGLEVTVDATSGNDETWIGLSAAALPRAAESVDEGGDVGQAADAEPVEAAEATQETDTTPPAGTTNDDAESGDGHTGDEAENAEQAAASDPAEEAARINARVSGWEYRIPEYKASQLTRHWEDLLSEPEAAAE